jgi:hypothetical protein
MPTIEEYDEWKSRASQAEAAKAGVVLNVARSTNPDQFASDAKLGKAFGVAPDLAATGRDMLQGRLNTMRTSSVLKASPRTAQWLRDSDNARAAWDDVESLSWFETTARNTVRSPVELGKAFPGGATSFVGMALEGAGQLLTPTSEKDRAPMVGRIMGAKGKSEQEINQLRTDIFQQGVINPTIAQSVLSDVISGDMSPDEARAIFEPAIAAVSESLQQAGEGTQKYGQNMLPAAAGWEDSWSRTIGSGLGSMLPVIVASVLTGGVGAAAFGGAAGAGDATSRAREAGQGEGTQLKAAMAGVLPGMTDAIPIERLLNNPVTRNGLMSVLRSIGVQAAQEGTQEAAQEMMQNFISQQLYNPDKSIFNKVGENAAAGGVVGAIVEAGRLIFMSALPGRVRRMPAQAHAAQHAQDTLNQIAENSTASKLRQRLDGSFADFVGKATDGTPIQDLYVPASKLQELFQSFRHDPRDFLADLPGVDPADYDMALSTGGDVRIPTAAYASKLAGTDEDAFLRENMRFNPEAMTATEAREFNENSQAIQLQAFEEAEAIRVQQEQERSVSDREMTELVGRLRAAGRSSDVAQFEAMPVVAMRRTMAERAGLTPEEFDAKYPLPEVRRERPDGFARKGVDELSRQLAELRSYVTQPEARGPSLLEAIDSYGGIDDVGGELASRDAATVKRGRFKKSLRLSRGKVSGAIGDLLGKASGTGKKHGFDDVARAMIEAGYLQDNATANDYRHAMETGGEVPDIGRALLEAIDAELGGTKQFATTVDGNKKAQWADDTVAYLDSIGVSINDSDEAIRTALANADTAQGREFGQASLRQKLAKLRKDIGELVDYAREGKEQNRVVGFAEVSNAVADLVEQEVGADIHGFQHTVDSSAIRHILKNHADAASEARRGMVAITDADILAIPEIVSGADQIVTGAKGRRGEDLIGYLKKMEDGTTLYIEEARRGRRKLAAVSMRKYPATADSLGIAKTINPNVRDDGGNAVKIVDFPENSKTFFQPGRRGSIQIPLAGAEASPVVISLFESADLSTMVHETGHYFLYTLQDLASPPGISPEIVEMHTAVKKWWHDNADAVAADAKLAGGMDVTVEQVRAYLDSATSGDANVDAAIEAGTHEQFARGFEAYLLEGKSPSVEMRSAFERFAQWLLRLYRSVAGLNVSISPELRTVFDRMLASDSEIETARSDISDAMLFAASEAAGISPEDYRHLKNLHDQAMDDANRRLRKEVMAPIVREREQWFKDEKAKVQADVTKRMQAMPIYRAIQEMRFGKNFEGEDVAPIKLDRAIVEAEYGSGHIPFLPGATKKGHGHVMAVFGSNGLHPDVVAGMYGFDSGRTLLEELENVPAIKDAIRSETDRVMSERHGDVLRDGSIEEEAIAALHGDKRGQFLAAELNVLNRKVGGKTTTSQEAREAVRRTMRTMKVRDAASPRRYLAAERKAANEAANAMAAGKMPEAAEAKRRQLLNYHFFMEASAREEQVDAIVDRMQRLNKPDHRLSKSRDIDYVKAARAIAGQFGLARAPSEFDMATWLEQLKNDDPTSFENLTQAIYVFGRGGQRSYRDITVNEFDEVKDAIENMLETGKLAREAEIDGKKVEVQELREELLQIARVRSKGQNVALERKLTRAEKVKIKALSLLASLRRVEAWARDMDDGKAGSYVRYLVNPVMDAVGVYRQEKAGRMRELLDIIEPRKGELLGGAIRAAELGYTFENKGELIHAILHTGNDSNKKKLLVGRGWEDGWDGFIARMQNDGTVTKADYDMVQQIWDLMERLKRPAQSAHRKMFGFYFNEIEATPVETNFGTYRGGYVPAIADRDASVDGTLRADQQALQAQTSSAMFPTTGRGFTKSRSEGYTTPLALDLLMIPSHMDKVLRFTHIQPAIQQTQRIVNNVEFRTVINEVSPGIIENMVTPWLQRAAQQAVESQSTTPAGRAFSSVVREIRRRVGVHTMFLNIVNTAQQVTGFSSAMVLVKPGRLKSALVRFSSGDAGDMRSEATELSRFMADRIDSSSREMQVRIQEAIVKPGALGVIREKADKYGYILQQGSQNVVDVIVWHAAYDQAVAGGMDQADAVREADSVIRRSMGSFAPEDISMVESGPAFIRLFTMFYSYFNGQANLVGGELQTIMRTYGYHGAPKMFAVYMFGIAIPGIVGEAIAQAARGELGDDDDDDGYMDEIAGLFFGAQARYASGMVPIAGQAFNAFINTWNDKPYDDRLSTSAAIPAIERVLKTPVSVYNAAVEGKSPSKAVQDSIISLGMILGIPTGQLAKSAGYAGSVAEGDSKPENAFDVLQGAISGRDGTEK